MNVNIESNANEMEQEQKRAAKSAQKQIQPNINRHWENHVDSFFCVPFIRWVFAITVEMCFGCKK